MLKAGRKNIAAKLQEARSASAFSFVQ